MDVGVEASKRFATNVAGTLAGFLGTLYFTRELGFDGVGTYAIFVSLQMVAAALATFGLFVVLTKRVSEGRNQAAYLTTGALLLGVGVAVVAAVAVAFRGVVNDLAGVDVALLVPLGVLTWGLFRLSGAFLEGQERVALAGALANGRHAVVVQVVVEGLGAAHGALRLGVVLVVAASTYFALLLAFSERIRVDAVAVARDLLADSRQPRPDDDDGSSDRGAATEPDVGNQHTLDWLLPASFS